MAARTSSNTARARSWLEAVPWSQVNRRVRAQQRNRERHAPTVSVYRWWARRPHALIGALLDGARSTSRKRLRVGDPFSGGGTVAVEAARRGFSAYAQDLHPWATLGLSVALDGCHPRQFANAADELLQALVPVRRKLYRRTCPTHGRESELVHVFRVSVARCPECRDKVYLYPYPLISLASRTPGELFGYFGCSACGGVTRSALAARYRRCSHCRLSIAEANSRLTPARVATCRSCRHEFHAFRSGQGLSRKAVLVYRICTQDGRVVTHFDHPTPADLRQPRVPIANIPRPLRSRIPEGIETAVLRHAGFRVWRDLYPPRQLRAILAAMAAAKRLKASSKIRRRLLLAVCGLAEGAGCASRWDRYYPKNFELLSNHRFSPTGFSCETNPFAPKGRGTLPRRLRASCVAARWVEEQFPSPVRMHLARSARRLALRSGSGRVVTGSSERQHVPRNAFDLVLTDPPYFAAVQYAELGELFFVWAKCAGFVHGKRKVEIKREAVPNRVRGTDARKYERVLARVFGEVRRTLDPRGRLILTFQNRELVAWASLGRALRSAGFGIHALAVARAENDADHSKRDVCCFTKDLVVECRPTQVNKEPRLVHRARDDQDRELFAAGAALADVVRGKHDDFVESFNARFKQTLGSQKRIIAGGSRA